MKLALSFLFKNWKWLAPALALVVYVLLSQWGCVGKKRVEVVTEIKIDTVYQTIVVNDTVTIPVPKTIKVPIYITDTKSLEEKERIIDSLQTMYYNRTNKLNAIIAEYQNAVALLKEGKQIPVLTVDMYEDTIKHPDYMFSYAIGVSGFMESFKYTIETYKNRPKIVPPKTRHNFIGLGASADFRGLVTPKLFYGRKNVYFAVGYTVNHPEGHTIKNAVMEFGFKFNF